MVDKKNRLTGLTFGLLYVIGFNSYNKSKSIMYDVECGCEDKTKLIVSSSDLRSGRKDNCGCETKNKQRNAKKKYNNYNLDGEYGVGYTTKGEEFYFDLEDYDLIKDYCWNFHGDNRGHDYLVAKGARDNEKIIRMHRLVMDAKNGEYVDHIYHKTNDNRKSQLRKTTNQQNCFNHKIHSHNTHGNKGLTQRENGNWRARIWVDYKTIELGTYSDINDAIKARNDAENKYHKEYKYVE